MANLTDPLANAIHGTDPQSLMEYMTRQKIYDSRYWKEECFGLNAIGVLEKATQLRCIGASFGGNHQPTKFISLVLKLLQLQPDPTVVDEFLETEDFKYVRVLGAMYTRLTARPAETYRKLEPWKCDYRKLRYRDRYEWKLEHVDVIIHSLLCDTQVCGISLPRLPSRRTLEEEGYLEPYQSPIVLSVGQTLEDYLLMKVDQGSIAAKVVWKERQRRRSEQEKSEEVTLLKNHSSTLQHREKRKRDNNDNIRVQPISISHGKYGTLFKKSTPSKEHGTFSGQADTISSVVEEGSEEYWNEQRAKVGLGPLKK